MLVLFHKTALPKDKNGFCLKPWKPYRPYPHSALWWLLQQSSRSEVQGRLCADVHTIQPHWLTLLLGSLQQQSDTTVPHLLCCLNAACQSIKTCRAFMGSLLGNQVLKVFFSEFI